MEVEAGVTTFVQRIVAPGDVVLGFSKVGKDLKLGAGLRQDGDCVVVTKSGRFKEVKSNEYTVEGSQKKYIPSVEDKVIGIVIDRRFETYNVDIKAPQVASLPVLAFERATRRNAPNLQVGAAFFARVVKSLRDSNPELSCMDANNKASGFGPLKGGYIFDCSTGLASALLSKPTCAVLDALGKSISFEITVGKNGRVWVNAESPATIILVSNAIMNAEFLTPVQQRIMVRRLLERKD